MHEALLYQKAGDGSGAVNCRLCSHYCHIEEGNTGTCKLRVNEDGTLFTMSWGNADGAAIDPIEKKPFFHYKPNTRVLSFGTPGCNFRCLNCQNSHLSQVYRNYHPHSDMEKTLTPEQIVNYAEKYKVDGIAYTYSEPTIFFEYARDTVLECRRREALCSVFHVLVSNGFFSPEMLELSLKEDLFSAVNIDLKFMSDGKYRDICGGRLQPVLDNIRRVYDAREKMHMEIINLVIPGENDSDDDFVRLCEFMASVSPEIPLHFNRFYPKYKMANKDLTELSTLTRAKETAIKHGLKYVYIGNASLRDSENTYCPECGALLVERHYYEIGSNCFEALEPGEEPRCPKCGALVNFVV